MSMNEPVRRAIWADLPCPFCGGRAELHSQLREGHVPDAPDSHAYFYVCDSCACTGGWGKSDGIALRMWDMRTSGGNYCRGEGCPRADLCRRHMDASRVPSPIYFKKSPMRFDGQCGEFASNGWLRAHPMQCGGTHPPPQCAWQCQIELHRWEKRGDEWIWGGEEN